MALLAACMGASLTDVPPTIQAAKEGGSRTGNLYQTSNTPSPAVAGLVRLRGHPDKETGLENWGG
jgi:hypothetical protein